MENKWKLLIVSKAASQEILDMSADVKAKFLHISELMIKLGPINMGMPHIKHLEDKLWEIRVSGKTTIARSIYCLVHNKKIVILHSFIKKTQRTPKKAIEVAKQRMKEVNLL